MNRQTTIEAGANIALTEDHDCACFRLTAADGYKIEWHDLHELIYDFSNENRAEALRAARLDFDDYGAEPCDEPGCPWCCN